MKELRRDKVAASPIAIHQTLLTLRPRVDQIMIAADAESIRK
jgi:hypothetical protein